MKRAAVIAAFFLLWTGARAHGQDAMDYYNRGLKSSLAYKRIEYFTEAIRLDPRLAEAYEKRAIHYFFQRRFMSAMEDYTKVIELKPNRREAYLMRGLSLMKSAHPDGFWAELGRLWPWLGRLWTEDTSGYLEWAISDFGRAIELSPELADAYSYRAEAFRYRGMFDEALEDCSTVLAMGGDAASAARAYANRAEIHRKLGQFELYEADFRRSIEFAPFTPGYPPLHVPLTERYLENMASLNTICRLGLIGVIVLAFAIIFKVGLPAPKRRDRG